MYFFHSDLYFRILPFTISIYTKIARTRQSKDKDDAHQHHTRIRFIFSNACTPGGSTLVRGYVAFYRMARKIFFVIFPKLLVIDVRINLCRRKIRVTEQFLNGTQIGPSCKQVRRKRVAQRVHFRMNAAFHFVSAKSLP